MRYAARALGQPFFGAARQKWMQMHLGICCMHECIHSINIPTCVKEAPARGYSRVHTHNGRNDGRSVGIGARSERALVFLIHIIEDRTHNSLRLIRPI